MLNLFSDKSTISYHLPPGISKGELIIYEMMEIMVDVVILNENQETFFIESNKVVAGIYIAILAAKGRTILKKKLIVVK